MTNTFKEYLTNEKSLSIGQMEEIHQLMTQETGDDEDALELYEDLLADAIKYAAIRAEWTQMTREEKMDRDPYRTAIHDSVIMDINVLARYLRKNGKEAKWRDMLGDEESDRIYRKTIGDFACYLAFVNAICMR